MPTRDKTTGKVSVLGTSGGNGSFPSLPAAGSTIMVMLSGANGTLDYAAGSVTDNQGNPAYTQAVQSVRNSNGRSAIFYAPNIGTPSGTFTITVNTPAGTWFGIWVATSFTGMAAVPLDQTSSSSGSSTTPTSGATPTTTQADEVLAAAMQIRVVLDTTLTVEALSPAWVEEAEDPFASSEAGEHDTRIVTAAAAMTANWTSTQSATWTAAIATFKGAGAAAPDTIHYMTPGSGWPRRIDRVRVQ